MYERQWAKLPIRNGSLCDFQNESDFIIYSLKASLLPRLN